MSTEDAFIAAIAADVESDLHRLVYADWLDENDRPERAAFIRLMCGDDSAADRARAAELLAAHGKVWDAPLATIGAKTWYRRGFPYMMEVEFPQLVEHQSFLSVAPEWHLILNRAERDYSDDPETDLCARFATGPFADRISGLNLSRTGWDAAELAALFVPPLIGRLHELRFGDDDTGPEAVALLVMCPDLALREFGYGGDSEGGIGDGGCRALAASPAFGLLTVLELPNNGLGPGAAVALARSPHLIHLERLDLAGGSNTPNRIGPEGAIALAGSTNFRHLTSLDLMFNHIRDDGFAALVRSPNLPELTSLHAPGNDVTDAGILALAASPGVPELNWLNLSAARAGGFTAVGIRALAESPRMARFAGLKIAGNRIGDAGAFALADAPGAANLTTLELADCGIGIAGFTRMLESPHLAGVKKFALNRNAFTASEVQDLKAKYPGRAT